MPRRKWWHIYLCVCKINTRVLINISISRKLHFVGRKIYFPSNLHVNCQTVCLVFNLHVIKSVHRRCRFFEVRVYAGLTPLIKFRVIVGHCRIKLRIKQRDNLDVKRLKKTWNDLHSVSSRCKKKYWNSKHTQRLYNLRKKRFYSSW